MMLVSTEIGKLAAALAKAQGVIEDAVKGSTNPHFRSRYADLAAVRAAIQKPLSDNGLAYIQLLSTSDDGLDVKTMLIHGESGEYIGETLTVPLGQRTPQAVGSAASYGRRYGLMAIIGLAADDDDANAAQEAAPRKSSAKAKRDGDWDRLQNDMLDAGSAHALQRLWDGYRQREYSSWSPAWRQQAEELFERRMAEFSAADLGEVLSESLEAELPKPKPVVVPNAKERAKANEATEFVAPTAAQVGIYRERLKWLQGATTMAELRKRGKNLEHLTELEKLTPQQIANLREAYAEQMAAFKQARAEPSDQVQEDGP